MASYSDLTAVSVDNITITKNATGELQANKTLESVDDFNIIDNVSNSTTSISYVKLRTFTLNANIDKDLILEFLANIGGSGLHMYIDIKKNGTSITSNCLKYLNINTDDNNLTYPNSFSDAGTYLDVYFYNYSVTKGYAKIIIPKSLTFNSGDTIEIWVRMSAGLSGSISQKRLTTSKIQNNSLVTIT